MSKRRSPSKATDSPRREVEIVVLHPEATPPEFTGIVASTEKIELPKPRGLKMRIIGKRPVSREDALKDVHHALKDALIVVEAIRSGKRLRDALLRLAAAELAAVSVVFRKTMGLPAEITIEELRSISQENQRCIVIPPSGLPNPLDTDIPLRMTGRLQKRAKK